MLAQELHAILSQMWSERCSLYYLQHTRTLAAAAYGSNSQGGSRALRQHAECDLAALVQLALSFLAAWRTVAFWCVLAALLHAASETLDAPFSLHVSLGLATQKPVQVIALATAWEGSAVGQIVTILLLSQWHVHLERCR